MLYSVGLYFSVISNRRAHTQHILDEGKMKAFGQAGITRFSLGVQSLNDTQLRFLGRDHTRVEAIRAVQLALKHFPRVSMDLMYGLPGQSAAQWRSELREALALLPVKHISLYQLTVEQRTRFHRMQERGQLADLPDNDEVSLCLSIRLLNRYSRSYCILRVLSYTMYPSKKLLDPNLNNMKSQISLRMKPTSPCQCFPYLYTAVYVSDTYALDLQTQLVLLVRGLLLRSWPWGALSASLCGWRRQVHHGHCTVSTT